MVKRMRRQKDNSLRNYEVLYQDMLEVTEKPKRALVTVIGITNQMDYFNQNYENQQQISGLIVADNGQDLFILTEYRIVENVKDRFRLVLGMRRW